MSTIEVENIGPVERLSIPVPEGGGLVILRGKNGAGKSETLKAIDSLVTGNGKVAVRQGALRGQVEGFGAAIHVATSTRRKGELLVESLEGRLSLAELVDPKLKDPAAADAKRIRALISLAGKEGPRYLAKLWDDTPQVLDEYLGPEDLEGELLDAAGRLKRILEAEARKLETVAENQAGRADACTKAAEGVDLTVSTDREELYKALQWAIAHKEHLQAEQRQAERAQAAIAESAKQLAEAQGKYSGPTLEEARAAEDLYRSAEREAEASVEEARQALARAEAERDQASLRARHATMARIQAEEHAETIAKLQKIAQQAVPMPVTDAAIAEAVAAVEQASRDLEKSTLAREAHKQLAKAQAYLAEQTKAAKAAEQLRESARRIDGLLSELVGRLNTPLRVEAGRLVLDTRRGATYFAELSHGERWRLAIDLALDVLGPGCIVTIPQEAWESLQPSVQKDIAAHAKARGVLVITAEATDDEEVTAEAVEVGT